METLSSQFANITIDAKNSILENLKSYIFINSSISNFQREIIGKKKTFNFNSIARKFKYSKVKPKTRIKSVNYKDVNSYAQNIVKDKVNDAIFVFNMDLFEYWILDLIRIKLKKYPKSFASKKEQPDNFDQKSVSIKIIKDSSSVEEIWEKIIGDYIYKMGYKDIVKHIELLAKHYNIKIIKDDLVGKINEFSLRRNIIVHNSKVVNDIYIRKARKYAKFRINETITIVENDLFEQTDILLRFMTDFQNDYKNK